MWRKKHIFNGVDGPGVVGHPLVGMDQAVYMPTGGAPSVNSAYHVDLGGASDISRVQIETDDAEAVNCWQSGPQSFQFWLDNRTNEMAGRILSVGELVSTNITIYAQQTPLTGSTYLSTRLYFADGSVDNVRNGPLYATGTLALSHLCFSIDTTGATAQDRIKVYVDGGSALAQATVATGSGGALRRPSATYRQISFGASQSTAATADAIDEIRMWSKALSEAENAANYDTTITAPETALELCLRLENNLDDESANNYGGFCSLQLNAAHAEGGLY